MKVTGHLHASATLLSFPIIWKVSVFVFFQHEAEYLEILTAVKGSSKEKRLASQFIARFFKHFPTLADQAIEAQLDLCEDEDVAVSLLFR